MLMHESLRTSSLLTKLKQESPLEVSTCGRQQNAIKGTPSQPFDHLVPYFKKTNKFGPVFILVRTKMKQLGGAGMPQDAGLSDFPKTKLNKTTRLV
jgi:hypothetical protein